MPSDTESEQHQNQQGQNEQLTSPTKEPIVELDRRMPSIPSPAVVFARHYAQNRGLQRIDYRKIVAQRALQRRTSPFRILLIVETTTSND